MWERINILGEIGSGKKEGVTRKAFTPEDKQARQLVMNWMANAGLIVRTDEAGNIFGKLEGNLEKPLIMTGSHIDTVPNGGKFDGAAGVIASLETLETMKEKDINNQFPVEMVIFSNEEGVRFPCGLMGSKALTGELDSKFLTKVQDDSGVTLFEAMADFGLAPEKIKQASRINENIQSFYELHIEQASVLDNKNKSVGIVNKIAGPHQLELEIYGQSEHSGATPMETRKDPMIAAAKIIIEVENKTSQTNSQTRGTVGQIKVYPGAHNVIPERVKISLDFRSVNANERESIISNLEEYLEEICEVRDLDYELKSNNKTSPVETNFTLRELMMKKAEDLELDYEILPSWAAHDAMIMSKICDIGMIFVRSQNGLSHCPEEYSKKEDIAKGVSLLANSIVQEGK